jgi:hypothetical protein
MQSARRRDRFFLAAALVMVIIVAVGFGPSLYLRWPLGTMDRLTGSPSLPTHLLVHGVILTAWFSLLAAQTLLVATSRTHVHRRLGWFAAALVPAVVVSSVVTMQRVVPRILEARAPVAANARAAIFERMAEVIVNDTLTLVVFVAFVCCALYFRSRPATHNRLMVLASAKLIAPALSQGRPWGVLLAPHLPQGLLVSTVFVLLFIAALVWHDLAARRRLEPATIWGSAAIIATVAAGFVIQRSQIGVDFTHWFAGVE